MFGRVARWLGHQVAGFPIGDLLLAALLCVVAVASVATGNPDEGPLPVTLPVAVVTTVALAWRSRSPVVSVALILVADLVQLALADPAGSLWSLVVFVIVMYSVAAHYTEGKAAIAGIVMVAVELLEERVTNGPDYLFIILLFGGVWLLGRASRLWRNRVSRAEQHQEDLARLAVSDERVRIARELHDVVAHSLSVIAVQADAAGAALDRAPELAREPLRVINTTARGSLHEIRDMLQLLRSDDDDLRPAPGLGALGELLESAARSGLSLEKHLELPEIPLPPVVDLAAYRILQEALTNVVRHAGAVAVAVTIRESSGALELEVVNAAGLSPRKPASGGLLGVGLLGVGLLGVRERVALLGGTLETGATASDGFRLFARLPMEGRSE